MPLNFKTKGYTDKDIEQATFAVLKAIQPLFDENDSLFFVSTALKQTSDYLHDEALFKLPPLEEKEIL